jgi:cell division transport system permease protein
MENTSLVNMKLFTHIRRVTVAAFQGLFRNAWLGAATIIVLTLTLISVNVLVGVSVLLERAAVMVQDRVDVTVFFKRDANPQLVEQAKFYVADLPQVQSTSLVASDEALEEFKKRHQADSGVLDALNELDSNPLGATLRIKARKAGDYPFIMETLKNPQFSEAIESKSYDDHADSIESVKRLEETAKKVGAILIAIFALIGILIVTNAVRVSIYTQREEIGIMRLVGAGSWYIRSPFAIQGMILAIVSLVITAGCIALAIPWVESRMSSFFDGGSVGLSAYFFGNWIRLALIEGGGLALLIGFTSWLAAGKYLKR